jgi:hypothetical protein
MKDRDKFKFKMSTTPLRHLDMPLQVQAMAKPQRNSSDRTVEQDYDEEEISFDELEDVDESVPVSTFMKVRHH